MDKKFTRRLSGAALAAAAALALAACSSGGGSSSGGGGGTTTLKLVVADYGTGPSNASAKYWDGIVTAFESAHPDIKVNVTSISWTNFDQQVQTMIQNKQYPDITEGDYFSNYAQDGLLYSGLRRAVGPGQPAAGVQGAGHLQRHAVRHAVHHLEPHPLLQQEAVHAGGHHLRPADLGRRPGRRGEGQGARRRRLRPAARRRGGAGRVAAVDARRRRRLHDRRQVHHQQRGQRRGLHLPQGPGRRGRHRAQPGHGQPHRPVAAVRAGQGRHDQRLARPSSRSSSRRACCRPPTGPRCRSRARAAR